MINVHGLHVQYQEAHPLRGVDIHIAPGEFVLLSGPSGSGKSTLARALTGLIPQIIPARLRGHITIDGVDPGQMPVAQVASRVGLVFQTPATQLFNDTVVEEVVFGPRNLDLPGAVIDERVAAALSAVGCDHLRKREVRHLSSGEQRRVAIAAVLAMRPRILLLDEPTADLDTQGVAALLQTLGRLHQQGMTVVVIEHRLEPFLSLADRLIWLEEGHVTASGPPVQTLARVRPVDPFVSSADVVTQGPLVTLDRVSAGYNGHSVLTGCSLTLQRGEFAALVGANGSGKTTLARVIARLLRPRRGRVAWQVPSNKRRVGFLQPNALQQLICDTVAEEISYGPRNLGERPDWDALAPLDLGRLYERLTRTLSVGQQQRTAMAAALVMAPSLLILDEPTVGQDWQHLSKTMAVVSDLNQAGQTVLLITHDQRLVERYANRVWRLEAGRVVDITANPIGQVTGY